MRPESQLLCVYLKHWPIDRLRRRVPSLRHEPLVLIDAAHPRQLITAVSPELPDFIHPGMPLAQARAFNAELRHEPADLPTDARALEALARWLMRFTPNVAIDPPNAIQLDIAGTHRLFGSPDRLCRHIAAALTRLQISAGVATAPTPGAAWALAAYADSPGQQPQRVDPQPQPAEAGSAGSAALQLLPPESLRLDPSTVQQLRTLGLTQVRLLLQLPREQLMSRFGPPLLKRIDQVTGVIPDPLPWLAHRSPIVERIGFDGVVDSLETLHLAVAQLLERAAQQLTRRGQGAREIKLLFQPPYTPAVEKRIQFARPNRDPHSLFKTVAIAIEALQTTEGFTSIELAAVRCEPLGHRQTSLSGDDSAGEVIDHLIERLQARFHRAIEWAQPVESHLPEKAYAVADNPRPPDPHPKHVRSSVPPGVLRIAPATAAAGPDPETATRPLRLVTPPREIGVMVQPFGHADGQPVSFHDQGRLHTVASLQGPERIDGQWWNNHWKTRDYFDVVDEVGHRHWVFQVVQNHRWFLHGTFE